MMILCPEILSDQPECLHTGIKILLDAWKDCVNFKNIFKNIIPRAFRIYTLVVEPAIITSVFYIY